MVTGVVAVPVHAEWYPAEHVRAPSPETVVAVVSSATTCASVNVADVGVHTVSTQPVKENTPPWSTHATAAPVPAANPDMQLRPGVSAVTVVAAAWAEATTTQLSLGLPLAAVQTFSAQPE